MKSFGLTQSTNSNNQIVERADTERDYETSFRSGGGIAIAALAKASTYPISGEFTSADYLKAAEDGFAFLEKNNLQYINDGKENIVDDYCALTRRHRTLQSHAQRRLQAGRGSPRAEPDVPPDQQWPLSELLES